MKKIFTLICSAFALMAGAKDYTAPMMVEIGDTYTTPAPATISLTENNGTYTFQLNNFIFGMGDNAMPIGNIVATGVMGTVLDGMTVIDAAAHATCTAGDDIEGVTWVGPILLMGGIDLEIQAQANDDEMIAIIDMDIQGVGEIEVYFGQRIIDFELSNDDQITYDEPLAVDFNGALIPQGNAVVTLTEVEDEITDRETYTLELKNFIFSMGEGNDMAFGNIVVEGLKPLREDYITTFDTDATAYFTAGDTPGIDMWLGPALGSNPMHVTATITWLDMEATLTLTVPNIGNIVVYYGAKTVGTAGISNIAIDRDDNAPYYNLQGIPVANPIPGQIYIQSGRKIKF